MNSDRRWLGTAGPVETSTTTSHRGIEHAAPAYLVGRSVGRAFGCDRRNAFFLRSTTSAGDALAATDGFNGRVRARFASTSAEIEYASLRTYLRVNSDSAEAENGQFLMLASRTDMREGGFVIRKWEPPTSHV